MVAFFKVELWGMEPFSPLYFLQGESTPSPEQMEFYFQGISPTPHFFLHTYRKNVWGRITVRSWFQYILWKK